MNVEREFPGRLTPELLRELNANADPPDDAEDERSARAIMRTELRRAADAAGTFACRLLLQIGLIVGILGAVTMACSMLYLAITGNMPAWFAALCQGGQ